MLFASPLSSLHGRLLLLVFVTAVVLVIIIKLLAVLLLQLLLQLHLLLSSVLLLVGLGVIFLALIVVCVADGYLWICLLLFILLVFFLLYLERNVVGRREIEYVVHYVEECIGAVLDEQYAEEGLRITVGCVGHRLKRGQVVCRGGAGCGIVDRCRHYLFIF